MLHIKNTECWYYNYSCGSLQSYNRFSLCPQNWSFAASISTLVSYAFLAIYRMVDVQKFQSIKFNIRRFCLLIALLAIMCTVCWINTLALNMVNIIMGCIVALVVNRKIVKSILLSLREKMEK